MVAYFDLRLMQSNILLKQIANGNNFDQFGHFGLKVCQNSYATITFLYTAHTSDNHKMLHSRFLVKQRL